MKNELFMTIKIESLGEKMRVLRERKKITKVELAAALGVDEKVIRKYESNENIPKINNLKLIAKLLDTTIEFLTESSNDAHVDKEFEITLNKLYKKLSPNQKRSLISYIEFLSSAKGN